MIPVPDNRRFYHGKSPHPFRNLCLSLLIFVVICGLFSVGITRISNRTRQEQKNSLEHALWRGVTQYYALEGRYPETLQDLRIPAASAMIRICFLWIIRSAVPICCRILQ